MDDHKWRVKEKPWYKRNPEIVAAVVGIIVALAIIYLIISNQ